MRASLFWAVTQSRLVVTEVSGQPIGPIFKGQKSDDRKVFHTSLCVSIRMWLVVQPVNFNTSIFVPRFKKGNQEVNALQIPNQPHNSVHVKSICVLTYDIFVNYIWVDTRWQQYSTHLHTNNTQNNTMSQNTQNGTYIPIRIRNLQN